MSTTPPTVAKTTFWTHDRVAKALTPLASGNLPRGTETFGRVWTDTRTIEQKKRLFRRIADHLAESPGLRPEDVFINLVEVKKENWSFGRGEAQYA